MCFITSVLFLFLFSSQSHQNLPQTFFDQLNNLINDIYTRRISRESAVLLFQKSHGDLLLRKEKSELMLQKNPRLVFPLRGYARRDVGGSNGGSYIESKSYDFFDGNAHGGHPALDIFVYDRDQDCLDDRTKKPVDVLAVCDGIILCTNPSWTIDSVDAEGNILRGGKYVYLYSRDDDALWYYAHLRSVNVKPGDRARAGHVLGSVGRTGAHAIVKRSPTHVHLMYLTWESGHLKPKNPFQLF